MSHHVSELQSKQMGFLAKYQVVRCYFEPQHMLPSFNHNSSSQWQRLILNVFSRLPTYDVTTCSSKPTNPCSSHHPNSAPPNLRIAVECAERHRQWRFAKTKWLEGNGDGWITENKDYRASATKMMLITGDGAWEELRAPGLNWCEDTQHKSFGMLNNTQNLRHLNFRVCSASGWCIMTTECVMGKRRCRRRKSFLENRGIEERQDIWTPFTGKRQKSGRCEEGDVVGEN